MAGEWVREDVGGGGDVNNLDDMMENGKCSMPK
jgi:hypothetical protein